MIFRKMLSPEDAAQYIAKSGVPLEAANRVIAEPRHCRALPDGVPIAELNDEAASYCPRA